MYETILEEMRRRDITGAESVKEIIAQLVLAEITGAIAYCRETLGNRNKDGQPDPYSECASKIEGCVFRLSTLDRRADTSKVYALLLLTMDAFVTCGKINVFQTNLGMRGALKLATSEEITTAQRNIQSMADTLLGQLEVAFQEFVYEANGEPQAFTGKPWVGKG